MKRFWNVHGGWLTYTISGWLLAVSVVAIVDFCPSCLDASDLLQLAFSFGLSGSQLPSFFALLGMALFLVLSGFISGFSVLFKWFQRLICKKST